MSDKPTLRKLARGLIRKDRELADIQLEGHEPFIYFKKDTKDTADQIDKLYMDWFNQQLDGLTVLTDKENYHIRYSQYPTDSHYLKVWLTNRDNFTYNSIKQYQEAQLSHTIKQLKGRL